MRPLLASERELDERREALPRRIGAIIPDVPWIRGFFQQLGPHTKILALSQGSPDMPYSAWRVSSTRSGVSVAYYETWRYVHSCRAPRTRRAPSARRRPAFVLTKAYLHLYRLVAPGEEDKVVFLHCDPQDEGRFKMVPHLHLHVGGSPWDAVHIALCDGWQDQVLHDIHALDAAMNRAVELLAAEFLPLIAGV